CARPARAGSPSRRPPAPWRLVLDAHVVRRPDLVLVGAARGSAPAELQLGGRLADDDLALVEVFDHHDSLTAVRHGVHLGFFLGTVSAGARPESRSTWALTARTT